MNFTEFFIRRPVFSSVLSILLLLVGLVCYFKLPTALYPHINSSVINIRTGYAGATADVMESFVTSPIESAVAGVNGLDYITSSSYNGSSKVTLTFKLGYDLERALADVRDKVAHAYRRLPNQVSAPIIEKNDPNRTPIVFISFSSDTLDFAEITDYIKRVVQTRLETIEGVSNTTLMGGRDHAMRIWVDPNKMTHQQVSINDVISTLQSNNLLSPAGNIKNDTQIYSLTADTELHSAQSFNKLIIANKNGHFVRIEDIGKAELGSENKYSSANIDNKNAIIIGIVPRSDANQVQVSKEAKAVVAEIQPQLPKNIEAKVIWDNAEFITASIHEVKKTIIEATIFVVVIMLLFLGSFRLLLIPLVTIPLSLIGICSFMYIMGFSLNTLTFLAMVLAIGLVVDDAIVVVENIQRQIEKGLAPFEAAIKGAKEIRFAIISMTLTLAAVFAPIGFMEGLTGALFKEFAFTLAGAVIVSGFIALTLSPMMCAKLIPANTSRKQFFSSISNIYEKLLPTLLKQRAIAFTFMVLVIVCSYFIYQNTAQELAPKEDVGAILTIFKGPNSTNLKHTEKYSKEVANILNAVPEKQALGIMNGFGGQNAGMSFMSLQPWSKRTRSVDQIIQELAPKLSTITGVSAFAANPHSLPGAQGIRPVEFILQTTGSHEDLYLATQTVLDDLKKSPIFSNVDSDMIIDKPEYVIHIDRDRAGYLGIPMLKLAQAVSFALGDHAVGLFSMNGRSYDVIPTLISEEKNSTDIINRLQVKTASNELTPLANIISIQQKTIPSSLNHFMQMRSAKIRASLSPNYSIDQAVDYLKNTAAQQLPENITYSFSGAAKQYLNTSSTMWLTFGFALIFIFLLLAAQFESFVAPLVILFTVPLSILGALIALKLVGGTINIYTQIGFVTLIGLITKHGILIVEFANQLRAEGKEASEAIITAAKTRLRPILMTTSAIILGALPLALSTGAGAISRSQMGWVIIGGMSFGTLMTLGVTLAPLHFFTSKAQK